MSYCRLHISQSVHHIPQTNKQINFIYLDYIKIKNRNKYCQNVRITYRINYNQLNQRIVNLYMKTIKEVPDQLYLYSSRQNINNTGSTVKSNGKERVFHFRHSYQLLVNKVCLYNNVNFNCFSGVTGRVSNFKTECTYSFGDIINVAIVQTYKGTSQKDEDSEITVNFVDISRENYELSSIKFDMSLQRVERQQSKKFYRKQFTGKNGYIQYRFISQKSQKIQIQTYNNELSRRNQIMLTYSKTHDTAVQKILKQKDDLIKRLQEQISNLIVQTKKIKNSFSKQKDRKQQNISPLIRRLSTFGSRKSLNNIESDGLNFNVKVISTEAKRRQMEELKKVQAMYHKIFQQNNQLRLANQELSVQNKLLEQRINEMKLRAQKAVQNRYNKASLNLKDMNDNLKDSQVIQKRKRTKNALQINEGQHISIIQEFKQANVLDFKIVSMLDKLDDQLHLLKSKLAIKQEQSYKYSQQLDKSSVQVKKLTSELNTEKATTKKYKEVANSVGLDLDNPRGFIHKSMAESQSISDYSVNLTKGDNPYKNQVQKLKRQMTDSIIQFKQKIQEKEIELLKIKITEETSKKQKQLYENKYYSIMDTLQQQQRSYMQTVQKEKQLQHAKKGYDELQKFTKDLAQKYAAEGQARQKSVHKEKKYKAKLDQMKGNWERIKLIQSQYQANKKKIINSQKTIGKFELRLREMQNFLMKIQSTFYSVTNKRKKIDQQPVNEQQVLKQLENGQYKLSICQQNFFSQVIDNLEQQRDGVQNQYHKKLQFQLSLIDQTDQIDEQQKEQLKKAKEYQILQEKKNVKKKIQIKIKNYQTIKRNKDEQKKTKKMNLLDRIRGLQNRIKDMESLLQKIGDKDNTSKAQIQKIVIPLRRQNKELRQKITTLEAELKQSKQMNANSLFGSMIKQNQPQTIGFQSVLLPQNQSMNSVILTKKNTQGNLQRKLENSVHSIKDQPSQQLKGSQIVQGQYKKKYLQIQQLKKAEDFGLKRTTMMQGRQNVFMKSYEQMKKQNFETLKRKSQLQIQNQNYRFKEEKLILKHQQRQRELERMAKTTGDDLTRERDKALSKIQKYQRDLAILKKNNSELSDAMSLVIKELQMVSDMLQQKQQTLIVLEDQNALIKERLFNYQVAEQEMIQQIQKMRKQCEENVTNLNKLFQERNQNFLKIQKIKCVQIQKLERMIIELQAQIERQLSQFLSLKNKNQQLSIYIKNLQVANYQLQANQHILQEKMKEFKQLSTQQMLKLEDQNDFLKKDLIQLAQNTRNIQIQLAEARFAIESLQKQNQVLEPTYNEMCQMELKFQNQKRKYQQIIRAQNQKFVSLQQIYKKIQKTVEQVQQQNKNLQIRQLNFDNIKGDLNQRIFQKDKQVLKIQHQKNSILLKLQRLEQQIQELNEREQEKNNLIESLKIQIENLQKKTSRNKSQIRDQFGKSIRGSRQLGDDLDNNKSSRRSRLSGSSRNRTSIQDQGLDSSRKQMMHIRTSSNLRQSQSRSPFRKNQTLKSSSFRSSSPSKSPLLNRNNFGLQSVVQSPDDMKGTMTIQKNISKKNLQKEQNSSITIVIDLCQSQQMDPLSKNNNKKNIQSNSPLSDIKQYQIDQIQQSRYYNQNQDIMYQNNQNNFSKQNSQADSLLNLDRTDLLERALDLKDEVDQLYDQNDKLTNLLKKHGIYEELQIPNIQIHKETSQNSRQNGDQSSSIENIHNIASSRVKSQQNNKYQTSNALNIQSQFDGNLNLNISTASIRKRQSLKEEYRKNFIGEQKYNELKFKLVQKDLEFEEIMQELRKAKKQLDLQKTNSRNLLQQCSQLIKDCQEIQKDMVQKNQAIQMLNDMIQNERKQFQKKCEKLIIENLDKDKTLTGLSQKLDYLQQKAQKMMRKLSQQKDQIQQKNSMIKQYKIKIKGMITNYQQYEQQSELQILQLKESIDQIILQKHQIKDELKILAQKYVDLQCQKQNIQMGVFQKNQQINKGKNKNEQIVNKYNEIVSKYQVSEKNRQELISRNYALQTQLKQKEDQIQQLHRNSTMYTKKAAIKLQTQKKQLESTKLKLKEKDQHLTTIKHEIALYNDECGQLKKVNKQLNDQLNKVQKQLKDIMNQYQEQFKQVSTGAGNYSHQVQQLTKMMQQKDKQMENKRKALRQKQGQIYRQRQTIQQLQGLLSKQKTKNQQRLQELTEKYEFKNDQFQKFKFNYHKEITFKDEDFKKLNKQQSQKQKSMQTLKQKLNQKQLKIQILTRQITKLTNKQKQIQAQQKSKIQLLNYQIQNLKSQINATKQPNIGLQKEYNIFQAKSRLQKSELKSQLDNYSSYVQSLQKQNFYLKRQGEAMAQTLSEIKGLYSKNQRKLKNNICQLQEEVQFYKAKRIDQMNKLLNETDD